MAVVLIDSGMNIERKDIHPFFSKTNHPREPSDAQDNSRGDNNEHSKVTLAAIKSESSEPQGSGHFKPSGNDGNQRLLNIFSRREPNVTNATSRASSGSENIAPKIEEPLALEEDPNEARRKRRKTASPDPPHLDNKNAEPQTTQASAGMTWHSQLRAEANKHSKHTTLISNDSIANNGENLESKSSGTAVGVGTSETLGSENGNAMLNGNVGEGDQVTPAAPQQVAIVQERIASTPPKKMLKLNARGGLGSPIDEQEKPKEVATKPKKRGRPRKNTKELIVILKYPLSAESTSCGQKIENILIGNLVHKPKETQITPKLTVKPTNRLKPTHPFFHAKADTKPSTSVEATGATELQQKSPSRKVKQSITPGKLRAQAMSKHLAAPAVPFPTFGSGPGFSKQPKIAGLKEAPFPSRDTSHIRCLDDVELELLRILHSLSFEPISAEQDDRRKMKRRAVTISAKENVIANLENMLSPLLKSHSNSQGSFLTKRASLRLPKRLLTTGREIQSLLRLQLSVAHEKSDTGSGKGNSYHSGVHPAVAAIIHDFETSLTPFDVGRCETMAWTQKYAPKCAAHVLQTGKDVVILKNWLKSLTVSAVSGSKEAAAENAKSAKTKVSRKKRKKAAETDDFIVGSEDEDELDFISVTHESSQDGPKSGEKSSLLRGNALLSGEVKDGRVSNVVVISGPHGCGKTAAIYAVAKELGFEIFEINSSSRRSGKDILDRIGDMTENHLVRHHTPDPSTAAIEPDQERITEALQKDIDTGRQGKMTTFFQKNSGEKQNRAKTKSAVKDAANGELKETKPRKLQKQSLILFEEADILYDEDKNFWPTILNIAFQSKRPIVITCTNESVVPMESLPLQAILRFSDPPSPIAVDYLLALAANEGHLLDRGAVSALFEARDNDLRASIVELNFWCQMAVGDEKGGLEWMYQRWPPGSDIDKNGHKLRVASQGTYVSGMGWTPRDKIADECCNPDDKAQDVLQEIWKSWNISPDKWIMGYKADQEEYKPDLNVDGLSNLNTLSLQAMELISESYSVVDVCGASNPLWSGLGNTDCAYPSLSESALGDFTSDRKVLQTEIVEDYPDMGSKIGATIHCMTQRLASSERGFSEQIHKSPPKNASDRNFVAAISSCLAYQKSEVWLTRRDFADALDPIAEAPSPASSAGLPQQLNASSFDREFRVIHTDIAPFVRLIAAHDLQLEEDRLRKSNLLSLGGNSAKRMRTTRSAWSALEGGRRETTRRERWFAKELNLRLVLQTGGTFWTSKPQGLVESVPSECDDNEHTIE